MKTHWKRTRTHAERGWPNKRSLGLVFGLSFTYLVVEVVGGLWTGSLALLADLSARQRPRRVRRAKTFFLGRPTLSGEGVYSALMTVPQNSRTRMAT